MKNRRGMITLDFLFAFILVMTFGMILFTFSLTLTVVDLTQYITFAAARNYMAAHLTEELQEQQGLQKYDSLILHPSFRTFYNHSWYKVLPPDIGDITLFRPEYRTQNKVNKFIGVGTGFTAHILEFNSPFYGSTDVEGTGAGDNFNTYIASYLGREVSTKECMHFVAQRWNAIRALPAVDGAVAYSQAGTSDGYVVYDDNGC